MNGWVEYKSNCYLIDEINFTFVAELIDLYAPHYATNVSVEVRLPRLQALARVVSYINSHIPPFPFYLGLNRYSLDTEADRKGLLGYEFVASAENELTRFQPNRRELQAASIPPVVDWAAAGAMTEVKDQGRCGCCWAVSTTTAVESAAFLTNHSGFLQSLSFQQLISCDTNDNGCNGGNLVRQFCLDKLRCAFAFKCLLYFAIHLGLRHGICLEKSEFW